MLIVIHILIFDESRKNGRFQIEIDVCLWDNLEDQILKKKKN